VVEYTYYQSGHWSVVCTVCGSEDIYTSLKQAHDTGRKHARECGT
jgi:hypothetical protein